MVQHLSKNPILIECVPKDATGQFILLYVPFGEVKPSEVAEDLKLVAAGVQAMLTVYGFGAKTSSGFGVADVEGKGELAIRADVPDLVETSTPTHQPEFLNDDGSLNQDFLNDDGDLKSQGQYKKFCQKQGKTYNENLYKKAKQCWEARMQDSASDSKSLQPMTKVSFVNWGELCDRAQTIAQNLGTIQ